MDIYVIVAVEELALEGLPANGLHLDHDCIITTDRTDVLEFLVTCSPTLVQTQSASLRRCEA